MPRRHQKVLVVAVIAVFSLAYYFKENLQDQFLQICLTRPLETEKQEEPIVLVNEQPNFPQQPKQPYDSKNIPSVQLDSRKIPAIKLDSEKIPAIQHPKGDTRDLWQGLNPAEVGERWNGITLDGDYVLREFIDPDDPRAFGMGNNPRTLDNMTDADAEDRFFQLVDICHVRCGQVRRMGRVYDGGWDVCVSQPYKPHRKCIVYSFGINYDFSFDDDIGNTYHCKVVAYDPSMRNETHQRSKYVYFYKVGLGPEDTTDKNGWKIMSLESILNQNGHTEKIIDYLKMDIEHSEWATLEASLRRGTLKNVKQFALEIHTGGIKPRFQIKSKYFMFYKVLLELEKQGFRRYHYHYNHRCRYKSLFTGKLRTACHEIYYININYLKQI